MYKKYPHLLSPLKVGKTIFRNRIFSAPMTLHALQGGEPYPTEAVIEHFASKAKGGAAVVTCAGVSFEPVERSDGMHASYDVYTKQNLHYLTRLVDRIHFYGAKASMECGNPVYSKNYAVSPGVPMMTGAEAEEMPEEIMEWLADRYAYTANALKSVGFDMILLHFGHGLLVSQFLSPLTNKRIDKYGGSLENRARFPIMILDRIREKVGRDLLIELRISGAEKELGGLEVEESIRFVKMVEDKIDLIQVSAGMHNTPRGMTIVHPSGFMPSIPNVHLAEAVKKSGVKIPVIAIGGIQNLDEAEKILADGRADVVTMARGMIADPNLAKKAYAGKGEDVVPCIKCYHCHDSDVYGTHFVCSVNPITGLEYKLPSMILPAFEKKKVVVVGGGPAGMEAALIAAQRGHDVTLIEKSGTLGGQLLFSDYVSFKCGLKSFKDYLVRQVTQSNIRVCLNTEATYELLEKEKADVILAAIGAEPVIPSIQGIDGKIMITAAQAYGREEQIGQKIVVIGGGQVGCETALHLAKQGLQVTIVEMQCELAPDASTTYRSALILQLDDEENLKYITGIQCTKITERGITYADKDGTERELAADTVVLAVGMKAKQMEAETFRQAALIFVPIGDCTRVANVEKAMRTAFDAAINL